MKGRNLMLAAAAAVLASSAAGALDLREGRMLLSLDERTARFSVHYLADAARNRYVSLLSEQDARTTYPTLSWDGRTYRLGESPEFRFSVRREGSSAIVEYASSFALVRQSFRFLRSRGASEADGLLLQFEIENLTGNPASAGLRLLLDTYQGERGKRHFEFDGSGVVNSELSLTGSTVPSRLVTPGEAGSSLQVQLAGDGITRPNRLVLSNWKRINDAEWVFEVTPGRSFTLLPFSIDDSAAAVFFEPSELRGGGKRIVTLVLGNKTDAGYAAPATPGGGSGPASAAPDPQAALTVAPDPFVGARTDVAALREIIARIDGMLKSDADPEPDRIEELRKLLESIRSRTREY